MKASRSESRKKNTQKSSVATDDQIDEIIRNITLKRPKNAYTQYVLTEIDKFKKKNKGELVPLMELNKQCAEKWKNVSDSEKGKYEKLYEAEKEKYKKDLETVKHYLFKDYNETRKSAPTAYRIFLNEKMRAGLDTGEDPQQMKAMIGLQKLKMLIELLDYLFISKELFKTLKIIIKNHHH